MTSCSAFSAAPRAYQVFLSLVSQRNKTSHPFRIPIRKIGIFMPGRWDAIPNTVGMELTSLHCGNGQNLFVAEMRYILYNFLIHLLFCLLARLPDCLVWFCFLTADRQRMYFYHVLSLNMCKESKDKLCYSDVLMFRPFYMYVLCKQLYSL